MPKPTQEKLTEAVFSLLNKPDNLVLFLNACVIDQLKQTVEENSDILADRKKGPGGFSEKEIEQMKRCSLRDLKYTDIENNASFIALP